MRLISIIELAATNHTIRTVVKNSLSAWRVLHEGRTQHLRQRSSSRRFWMRRTFIFSNKSLFRRLVSTISVLVESPNQQEATPTLYRSPCLPLRYSELEEGSGANGAAAPSKRASVQVSPVAAALPSLTTLRRLCSACFWHAPPAVSGTFG